jgi:hypothetical protein
VIEDSALIEPEGSSELDTLVLPEVMRLVGKLVEMFEEALEVQQVAQSRIPAPSLEEVAEMRQGTRPLTREAYLIAVLQRCMVGTENQASDLRIDEEVLRGVAEFQLTEVDFNALEEAVTARGQR